MPIMKSTRMLSSAGTAVKISTRRATRKTISMLEGPSGRGRVLRAASGTSEMTSALGGTGLRTILRPGIVSPGLISFPLHNFETTIPILLSVEWKISLQTYFYFSSLLSFPLLQPNKLFMSSSSSSLPLLLLLLESPSSVAKVTFKAASPCQPVRPEIAEVEVT